jgi:hypothetical protein
MKNKKNILLILAISVAIFVAFFLHNFYSSKDLSLNKYLGKAGISMDGGKNYLVESVNEAKKDELNVESKNGDELIRTTFSADFSEDAAKKMIQEQEFFLMNLYKASPPPYPELIGESIDCEQKYVPVKKTIENGVYYTLLATSRFTFGVCTDELGKYKSAMGYLYCKNSKTLLKIEYFSPKDNDNFSGEQILGSLRCRK